MSFRQVGVSEVFVGLKRRGADVTLSLEYMILANCLSSVIWPDENEMAAERGGDAGLLGG